MDNNQENLEEMLDFILKSDFSIADQENIFKTIEYLQQIINSNEHRIQNEQKKATQYKKQNKLDKSKECLQNKKEILKKNDSIFNVIIFLENKTCQLQINNSISSLNLKYLENDDNNENYSNLSDTDENSNQPNEIKSQKDYFKYIFDSISSSCLDFEEEKNINISIDNLISNLDENEQRSQQILEKSIEYKRQKENNQVKNHLQINKILTFYIKNIIQLISILLKKLTLIQINKCAIQLQLNISVEDEFPNIQTDESEQQNFFDKVNNEILTAKFHSKDEQSLSISVKHLKIALNENEQRIQKEEQKIQNFKANKKINFAKNHVILKTNIKNCDQNIREILENIEIQHDYTQQSKISSKLIKKYSKKNISDEETNIENELNEQIDEFNNLKDEFDEFGDMMNFDFSNDINNDDDDFDA